MGELAASREEASELEWLKWFATNADFGPAHGDVMVIYMRAFESEKGKRIPEEWRGYLDETEEWEASQS